MFFVCKTALQNLSFKSGNAVKVPESVLFIRIRQNRSESVSLHPDFQRTSRNGRSLVGVRPGWRSSCRLIQTKSWRSEVNRWRSTCKTQHRYNTSEHRFKWAAWIVRPILRFNKKCLYQTTRGSLFLEFSFAEP